MPTMLEMKQAIRTLVDELGHVSFAEIEELPDAKGPYASEVFPNVWVWSGLSKLTIEAIAALRQEGAVHYVPTNKLTYLVDGVT